MDGPLEITSAPPIWILGGVKHNLYKFFLIGLWAHFRCLEYVVHRVEHPNPDIRHHSPRLQFRKFDVPTGRNRLY